MTEDLKKILREIKTLLEKIKSNTCSGTSPNMSSVEITNDCLKPLPVYFCENDVRLDPEVVCLSNDGGVNVLTGWEVFDVSTPIPSSKLYIGGVEVNGYNVVPCNSARNYDYEKENICVDGLTYTKWYVWEGVGNLISILWLDQNDNVIPTPNPILINNKSCNTCKPVEEGFRGDNATLSEFNHFYIDIPACCGVTYSTSAGSIALPSKNVNWVFTHSYECMVTDFKITSTCDVNDIFVLLTKTK